MLPDDPDAQARLFYLALLGMVIASGVFYNYRNRLGTAVQHAAVWVLIFLGVTIAYGFKDQLASQLYPGTAQPVDDRTIALRRADDGHFYARVLINGTGVRFMVDTGATRIAITYEDAEQLGLRPHPSEYTLTTRTANGTGRVAPVALDRVTIGDVEVTNLNGLIAEPGKLHVTLLGMEFIRRLERFELRGRELLLVE